jgi:sporulation-control protein
MVVKKMLRRLGVGGPAVDTVLAHSHHNPGTALTGDVRLTGGEADAAIEHITLTLVIRAQGRSLELLRHQVSGTTTLTAGEERAIPFEIALPWGIPLTEVSGFGLPGLDIGLRTDVAIAKAVDKGDLDPVVVVPSEGADALLTAFGELGFQFAGTALQPGQLPGVELDVPFLQLLQFMPPMQRGSLGAVTLLVAPNETGLTVVLDAESLGGLADGLGRFSATHEEAVKTDWVTELSGWLDQAARRSPFGGPGYGQGQQGRGIGMGGIVAGVAGGVVGGMVLGEMLDGDDGGFF